MAHDGIGLQVDFGIVVTAASVLLAVSGIVYLLDRRHALRAHGPAAPRGVPDGGRMLLWAHLWYMLAALGMEAGAALPLWASVGMVVAGALWGMVAGYAACLEALRRRPAPGPWRWLAFGAVAGQALLFAVSGNFAAIFVTSSVLNGLLALVLAWRLRRACRGTGFDAWWLLVLPFLAIAAAYLTRLAMVLVGAGAETVIVASLAIGLVFPVAALFWVFGAMSLRSFHLTNALDRAANDDALTGLGNRMSFDRFVADLPGGERRVHRADACLAIDMDRFKEINDSYGHAAGDAVLVATAERLRALAGGAPGRLFRIGGDEFVVWCRLAAAPEGRDAEAGAFARALLEALCRPVPFDGVEMVVGASIGYAVSDGAVAPADLVRRADIALYCAKEAGRNRVIRYTPGQGAARARQLTALRDFRGALETGRLAAHFQPQVCPRSGRVAGCEVLARWSTDDGAAVEPAVFLALAEELDRLAELDRQVLDLALAALRDWRAAGLAPPRLSVNVSVNRLRDSTLIDELARRADLPRGALSFELLETAVAEHDTTLSWNIDRLREMGIGIEIDNFGTGHAAMSGVFAVRPDRIKIDRMFVRGVAEDPRRQDLLRALVDLVDRAGARTVIEGIETQADQHFVAGLDAEAAQGFAIAPPMPAPALARWLARRSDLAS